MADNGKLKLGLYWAASCGGCEIAIVELREKILVVDEVADILFWPVAIDAKYKDVEAMPDGHMDVFLFNGAIRTSENEEMAHLMRQKSKVLVAFGSCAHEGCIPGLANLFDRQSIFDRAYIEAPSVDNPGGVLPQTSTQMPEGEIDIIAKHKDYLVFIEVRTKKSLEFGSPEESITPAKMEKLRAVAANYRQTHENLPASWRIDVVAIELAKNNKPSRIELIENAVGDG